MEKQQFNEWAQSSAVSQHDRDADWFAAQYQQQSWQSSVFLYGRRQFERFFDRQVASLPAGARILDVGCGTGVQLAQLKKAGFQVHGVEPAEQMRSHAERVLPPGTVLDGSVISLPYADNSFDFVYSIEVFRYLGAEDNLAGLKEVRRVLKPGGVFFGTFVNRWALDGFYLLVLLRRVRSRLSGQEISCHTEFETPGELREGLASAGFSQVRVHGAMIASLRLVFKLGSGMGALFARLLEPIDPHLSDRALTRALSGHLIGIARK